MEEPAGKEKPKTRKKLAIMALVFLTAVGGAGGFLAPKVMASADSKDAPAAPAAVSYAHLDIGRIVVNLDPRGSDAKHLILESVVQYDASGLPEGTDVEASRLKIRDAFIGYLANISESEVRGTSGMSNLRNELLRRARVAFEDGAPRALLIQDYVLQ